MKLKVIPKYTEISEQWLHRDDGSVLGSLLPKSRPNLCSRPTHTHILPNTRSVLTATQLEAIECCFSEPAHLPTNTGEIYGTNLSIKLFQDNLETGALLIRGSSRQTNVIPIKLSKFRSHQEGWLRFGQCLNRKSTRADVLRVTRPPQCLPLSWAT